jgi:hypothetical protein
MTKLTPIQLDDETVIYIEATEDVDAPSISTEEPAVERGREDYGWSDDVQRQVLPNFQTVQKTIQAVTVHTLNAFKQVAIANVDKVTLEFAIEIGGEAGVPYVTKGTAKSNLKITVECSFPNQTEPQAETKKE